MAKKGFSEKETELIRQKLIESCRICWNKYGYKKTSVAEICAMSGISTGAFYLFYSSKELLFATAADDYTESLVQKVRQSVPNHPTKADLGACVKMMLIENSKNQWLFSLQNDYEVFLRKLPSDYVERSYKKDLVDVSELIRIFKVKPKVSVEEITMVLYLLNRSLYPGGVAHESLEPALILLVDGVIDKLFE